MADSTTKRPVKKRVSHEGPAVSLMLVISFASFDVRARFKSQVESPSVSSLKVDQLPVASSVQAWARVIEAATRTTMLLAGLQPKLEELPGGA